MYGIPGITATEVYTKQLGQMAQAQQQNQQDALNYAQLRQAQQQAQIMPPAALYIPPNVQVSKQKKGTFMEHLKEYFKNNRDIIFSVALIILIDHFVFKGAFREKIKAMVSTFCDKTHKMLENHGTSSGTTDAKS